MTLRNWRTIAVFAVLAIASGAAIQVISASVGRVHTGSGMFPASVMWLPNKIFDKQPAFAAWAEISPRHDIRSMLLWTIVFDVPFIVGYSGVLSGINSRYQLRTAALIALTVVADLLEDAASVWAISALPPSHPARYSSVAPDVLAWASLAKWTLLGCTLAGLFWTACRRRVRPRAR